MPVKVLIADDDAGSRQIVRRMIEGVVSVVGEAANDDEAMQMAEELTPDVILIDVELPVAGGVALTHRIKERRSKTKVILMTAHEEEAYLSDTGKSGADALLPKRSMKLEVLSVVRSVAADLLRPWDGLERRGRPPVRRSRWDGRERRREPRTGRGRHIKGRGK
jgi:DNA-binding NarL/FixJ family response regulator